MRSVTVQEAETNLEELLREVEAGEEIEIRRGDRPSAWLSPPTCTPIADSVGPAPAP